jgi:hypothetical protein
LEYFTRVELQIIAHKAREARKTPGLFKKWKEAFRLLGDAAARLDGLMEHGGKRDNKENT